MPPVDFVSGGVLGRATGQRGPSTRVDDHLDARITGAPALHDGRLYVPVASFEELSASVATYQ